MTKQGGADLFDKETPACPAIVSDRQRFVGLQPRAKVHNSQGPSSDAANDDGHSGRRQDITTQ